MDIGNLSLAPNVKVQRIGHRLTNSMIWNTVFQLIRIDLIAGEEQHPHQPSVCCGAGGQAGFLTIQHGSSNHQNCPGSDRYCLLPGKSELLLIPCAIPTF